MKRVGCVALLIPVVAACSSGGHATEPALSPSTGASSPASTPTEALVATFRGRTGTTTPAFSVGKGWELRYEANGRLSADLIDASGNEVAHLVDATAAGGGSVFPSQTGDFSLRIKAGAGYVIRIFNH